MLHNCQLLAQACMRKLSQEQVEVHGSEADAQVLKVPHALGPVMSL